tara:strand:+ start:864 stop:1016 length:153 start_codon:yes stop_codon:yes gene_type:complete
MRVRREGKCAVGSSSLNISPYDDSLAPHDIKGSAKRMWKTPTNYLINYLL